MKLTVAERLVVLSVLPEKGNLVTLRVVGDLTRALGFTEDELAVLKFDVSDQGTKWEQDVVGEVDIEIGPQALEVIRSAFQQLNAREELTPEHLSAYDKFHPEVV